MAQQSETDFDHDSIDHARNWPADFQRLRETAPRAWTSKHGGFWVASRYDDIMKIAQRPEFFTTAKVVDPATGAAEGGVGIPSIPSFRVVPNESEPPEWNSVRSLLNPRFSPKAIVNYRSMTERLVTALIDEVIERGHMDMVDDFTCPLPALLTMYFVGLPLHEWSDFAHPIHQMSSLPKDDPRRPLAMTWLHQHLRDRLSQAVAARRAAPSDDFIGFLAAATLDGAPLSDEMLFNITANVIFGGVDTTTALSSSVLHYLSNNPAARDHLIEHPEAIPVATEEFLRYFSPIHGAGRTVKRSIDLDGWTLGAGERLFLAYASANRDPAVFPNPETVALDRIPNRHVGFGAGMHRCLGSFLARQSFEIMLTGILARLPDFRIDDARAIPYPSVAFVNGWHQLPASFTPGRRSGAPRPW